MTSEGFSVHEISRNCLAGAGASLLSVIVTTPLDVVKHRMQAQTAAGIGKRLFEERVAERIAFSGSPSVCSVVGNGTSFPACPPGCYVYESTLDGLRKIARHEGTRVLWRGTKEGMLMSIPLVSIYLPLYDMMMLKLERMGHYGPVIAGAVSRGISLLCIAPLEILRMRVQVRRMVIPFVHRFNAAYIVVQFTVASGALMQGEAGDSMGRVSDWRKFDWGQGKGFVGRTRALWRGSGAMVARDVPFSAIYWGMLEPIRHSIQAKYGNQDPPLSVVLLSNTVAGAVAGPIAAGITTPMDVVKTRQQIQSSGNSVSLPIQRTLIDVWKNEGLAGLFSGLGPRCLRAAPSCAIVLSGYEVFKKLL